MSVRRPIVLLVGLVLATGACSGSDSEVAPAPSTAVVQETTTAPTTTTPPTTTRSTTSTTGVPRTTVTTTVTLGPGDASLVGTVSGPTGPIDGAIVRVERLVGKAVATVDVTTAGGGTWQLPSILGGSYRVRAFKAPDGGTSATETFFLAANERRNLDFKLTPAGGERITAVVNPSPPRVNQSAILTITVGTARVDDQGRTAQVPRPGLVLTLGLAPGQGLQIETPPNALTDSNGAASWQFRCTSEGSNTFTLMIGTGVTRVVIPNCGPPAPTTTARSG